MSKNHHFSHVMMLHIYFGCFVSGFAVLSKNKKYLYSGNINSSYVPCNIFFKEINLDKNNDMT